jgi:hypothetical protein
MPLPAGGDLVDEAVVERFPRVEIAAPPRVLGKLLGAPAFQIVPENRRERSRTALAPE